MHRQTGSCGSDEVSIGADIRQMGLAGWAAYAVDNVLQRITAGTVRFKILHFYFQPSDSTGLPARSDDSMHVGPIAPCQADPDAFERRPEVIAERFRNGSTCIAAIKGKELLGFMWLQFGSMYAPDLRMRLDIGNRSDLAWDYDMFIRPKYRLGKVFGRLWAGANEELRRRGCIGTLSGVLIENRASARAHVRLGARKIGWVAMICIGRTRINISSLRPWVSLSGRDRQPTLRFTDVLQKLDGQDRRP